MQQLQEQEFTIKVEGLVKVIVIKDLRNYGHKVEHCQLLTALHEIRKELIAELKNAKHIFDYHFKSVSIKTIESNEVAFEAELYVVAKEKVEGYYEELACRHAWQKGKENISNDLIDLSYVDDFTLTIENAEVWD